MLEGPLQPWSWGLRPWPEEFGLECFTAYLLRIDVLIYLAHSHLFFFVLFCFLNNLNFRSLFCQQSNPQQTFAEMECSPRQRRFTMCAQSILVCQFLVQLHALIGAEPADFDGSENLQLLNWFNVFSCLPLPCLLSTEPVASISSQSQSIVSKLSNEFPNNSLSLASVL